MNEYKIAVVVNPDAGKGKAIRICHSIKEILGAKNIVYDVYAEQWPHSFDSYTHIFLIGGDGTLNYFINKFPFLKTPISIFKGGSGNDFAWKLYGDLDYSGYMDRALNAEPLAVDAGICNGKYFINGVGIGFDGAVVKAMGNRKSITAGHLSYLWTVLRTIFVYSEQEVEICSKDFSRAQKTFMISIANGSRYGGGFMVAPDAIINDGLFDIIVIKAIHKLKRLFYLPLVEKGRHTNLRFVEVVRAGEIKIKSSRMISAHLDGEPMESKEFLVKLLPGQFFFR